MSSVEGTNGQGLSPGESLRIRAASTAEAALLSRFMARTFLDDFGQNGEPTHLMAYVRGHFSAARQSAELADASWLTLVVGNAGDYAGFAQLALSALPPPELAARQPAELHRFQLDRDYQGSDLAELLMAEVKAQARERGADVLWLSVWQQTARAIRFFRRHGFVVIGSQDMPLGDAARAAWVMAAPLER